MAAFRIVTEAGAVRLFRAGTAARVWDGAQFLESAPIDVAVRCVTDMAQPGDTLQIDDGPVVAFEPDEE